jgi:hypothetical protein
MEKISGNVSKFDEFIPIISKIRILAQSFVDKGVHPSDFKNGRVKNELIIEYSRRKVLEIQDMYKKMNTNQKKRIKHFLNIRSSKNENLTYILEKSTYQKLDKIYNFCLQVSKKSFNIKNPKSGTKKIGMKMGPNRKTRKKRRK